MKVYISSTMNVFNVLNVSVLNVKCIMLTFLIGSFALSEYKDGPYFKEYVMYIMIMKCCLLQISSQVLKKKVYFYCTYIY